ncbi:MAG: hypothetical protein HY913_06360 [Desulfomonile tiedjei]|nr:hypothetical protein [Desulfomonile tiedjei]
MNSQDRLAGLSVPLIVIFSLTLLLMWNSPGWPDDSDARCTAANRRWEQILQDLKDKLHTYASIQQTPVDRVIQRPILDTRENKTIAKQISDALETKEELLNAKRKECRNLLNLESQVYSEVQQCLNRRNSKDKDLKNITKNRQALIDRAVVTIAEVREVEGKETVAPYDAMGDPDPYRRSVNNYWQNYQQMYRRWWGQ